MRNKLRYAARVGDACMRLRKGGYTPDVVYMGGDGDYSLYVREVFPKTRCVVRVDWFHGGCDEEETRCVAGIHALTRLHNAFQLDAIADSDLAISPSQWQAGLVVPHVFPTKIRVMPDSVNTELFHPIAASRVEGTVTLCCPGRVKGRLLGTLPSYLTELLDLHPQCRVRILVFAPTQTGERGEQTASIQTDLTASLCQAHRERVEYVFSPPFAQYLSLLQESAVFVYLVPPFALTRGILEAMSCGALVLASDTAPVRELIRHGENGLLHTDGALCSLARQTAEVLAHSAEWDPLRRAARQTILEEHDMRRLLPQHAALVMRTEACLGKEARGI